MATILLAAKERASRKTHIMYRCNLNFKQLHRYLQFLAEIGLLRSFVEDIGADENPIWFETTDKGEDFIIAYRSLKALLAVDSR